MKVFMSIGYLLIIGFVARSTAAITEKEKSAIADKMIKLGLECARRHPITLSQIKAFQNKMMPDGKNPKCFAACMFKKVGVMDDAGMISPEGARQNAEHVFKNEEQLKNVDEIMKICSEVNKETTSDGNKGCDRAKLMHKCLIDNGPKYGFDFDF